MKFMTTAFKALFATAAILALASSTLITASLFIADRRPQTGGSFAVHAVVSLAFLALGVLLAGILVQVAGIVKLAATERSAISGRLGQRLSRLLGLLVAGGLALCGILAIITWAILTRIDQGFAVFG